jgi:predicted alpha/beta-hydrolase family hydrolase
MAMLMQGFRDRVALTRDELGGRKLVIGGRSMGGRVASHL